MRLVHLSDLHIGKRVNEVSMLEDQHYILNCILGIIDEATPDGVIIAGDIYDKTVPSAEAVQLFDGFLAGLAGRSLDVFMISGNHDSPERIAFAAGLLKASKVYIAPVYDGNIAPITLKDSRGAVNIYMLPFVKPANVRRYIPDAGDSYNSTLRAAVQGMAVDTSARNILITHQFVTGALTSESEEFSVGGADNVDAAVFDCFDYVALGHIHRPQHVCRQTLRYCGSPLKYSISEAGHKKTLTVVELGGKGDVQISEIELKPLRELRELKGDFAAVTAAAPQDKTREDYLHIILTDEEDVPEAVSRLRLMYPNIIKLSYDNKRTRERAQISVDGEIESKSPMQLFSDLYQLQNNQPMTEEQCGIVRGLIGEIWEGQQ